MAGRRPKQTSDDQSGTNPLKPGRRGGKTGGRDFEPGNVPQNAFGKGNKVGVGGTRTHGMTSDISIRARAEAIITAMLEDARCPDHLRSPAFAPTLLAWGRAEAISSLAYDWMCVLLDSEGPEAIFGLKQGQVKAISDVWRGHEQFASSLRSKLGLDPAGYARLSKDLGLTATATEDRLVKMAQAGHDVTSRRLGLVRGTTEGSESA